MALSEQRIIDDVAQILEVDASTVSRENTLADAGLDSLRMVMLVENWRAEGNEVDFQELISLPTLGQWIDALGAS